MFEIIKNASGINILCVLVILPHHFNFGFVFSLSFPSEFFDVTSQFFYCGTIASGLDLKSCFVGKTESAQVT